MIVWFVGVVCVDVEWGEKRLSFVFCRLNIYSILFFVLFVLFLWWSFSSIFCCCCCSVSIQKKHWFRGGSIFFLLLLFQIITLFCFVFYWIWFMMVITHTHTHILLMHEWFFSLVIVQSNTVAIAHTFVNVIFCRWLMNPMFFFVCKIQIYKYYDTYSHGWLNWFDRTK